MKLLNKDELIANELKLYFIKNNIKEGEKFPSEREIAEKYGAQRATVRSAYKILEEDGIVEIRERSGRYMSHPRIVTNLNEIKSFKEKVSDIGSKVENQLLSFELIEIDKDLYKKIKLPIGTEVYKITRVRKVESEEGIIPIAIEYSYVPESIAPKLIRQDLEKGSIFQILRDIYEIVPVKEEQLIEIVYANDFESKILKLDKMTAVAKKTGISYDKDGNVIQYLHAIMNKEWVEFRKEISSEE